MHLESKHIQTTVNAPVLVDKILHDQCSFVKLAVAGGDGPHHDAAGEPHNRMPMVRHWILDPGHGMAWGGQI